MNQLMQAPRQDVKLPPHSPDLCDEKKRPVHVGEDSDPSMPDAKRFKIDDYTVETNTTVAVTETDGAECVQGGANYTDSSVEVGSTAKLSPTDAAGNDSAPVNEPVSTPPRPPLLSTSAPPVVSPRDAAKPPPTATTISSFSSSNSSSSEGMMPPLDATSRHAAAPPLKSTLMAHLHAKYYGELEYMLQEFRKLERQLLGAKGNGSGIEESSGSRERREKLHSFILHLEDTIRQIEVGCAPESTGVHATSSLEAEDRTQDKDDVESVQKLEEHILANLLPVKVRLKRQLAAQQGATRNPIGMPATPRGLQPSAAADKGKGTFAAAAEEKRKQAEALQAAAREHAQAAPLAPSQFGQPLVRGASSLTQKLHGSTLGSQQRIYGHGVGSDKPPVPDPTSSDIDFDEHPKQKILYAGMAPGSNQHDSGVSAAAGVHCMIIETPARQTEPEYVPVKEEFITETLVEEPKSSLDPPKMFKPHEDPNLTEEERAKLQKERRRRKKHRELERREKERQRQLFLQQKAAQASAAATKGPAKKCGKAVTKAAAGKKKGPRTVEYICALCSEAYSSTCDYNPWWALASHECPKCRKTQVSTSGKLWKNSRMPHSLV